MVYVLYLTNKVVRALKQAYRYKLDLGIKLALSCKGPYTCYWLALSLALICVNYGSVT